ncbi:hypothetical protein FA95DRAFT_1509013 [Auriscalpium vulgare]|uniref:Uncharacterized protein n=1 Tax=Auriscalpium vulgare TaxID=40419 RepID=A0ACB8S9E8_9AGAM|nr:hypothetical protein FA95DRAFT_1509013 [Auriscalpium vulgare]
MRTRNLARISPLRSMRSRKTSRRTHLMRSPRSASVPRPRLLRPRPHPRRRPSLPPREQRSRSPSLRIATTTKTTRSPSSFPPGVSMSALRAPTLRTCPVSRSAAFYVDCDTCVLMLPPLCTPSSGALPSDANSLVRPLRMFVGLCDAGSVKLMIVTAGRDSTHTINRSFL